MWRNASFGNATELSKFMLISPQRQSYIAPHHRSSTPRVCWCPTVLTNTSYKSDSIILNSVEHMRIIMNLRCLLHRWNNSFIHKHSMLWLCFAIALSLFPIFRSPSLSHTDTPTHLYELHSNTPTVNWFCCFHKVIDNLISITWKHTTIGRIQHIHLSMYHATSVYLQFKRNHKMFKQRIYC